MHTPRHDGGLGPPALVDPDDAGADEGPERLVVVDLGRLDEGDVTFAGAAQPRRDGDPHGTAPDNDDPVVHPAELLWRGGHQARVRLAPATFYSRRSRAATLSVRVFWHSRRHEHRISDTLGKRGNLFRHGSLLVLVRLTNWSEGS